MDRVPNKRILCSCATAMSTTGVIHVFRCSDNIGENDYLRHADAEHAEFTSLATINDRRDLLVIRVFKPTVANWTCCEKEGVPPRFYDLCMKLLLNNWPAKPHRMDVITKRFGLISLKYSEYCHGC